MTERSLPGAAQLWGAERRQVSSGSRSGALPLGQGSEARVARIALLHAALAFAAATCFPMVLFVLGPVLLGVPHLAAGARHLVLRRSFPSSWQLVLLAGSGGLFALRLGQELGRVNLTRVETVLVLSWAAAAVLSGLRARPAWGRGLVAAAVLALAGAAQWRWPGGSRLVLLHLHNLVALVALLLFGARLGPLRWPLLSSLLAAVLLASGVLYRAALALGASAFGLHVFQAADWVAPGLRADHAVGLTSAYVFLQFIHYSIWLYVIPSRDLAGEAPAPLSQRIRALCGDLRLPGSVLLGLALLAVFVGSCIHLQSARALYLSLATFHVYLEVILLGRHWIVHGDHRAAAAPSLASSARAGC